MIKYFSLFLLFLSTLYGAEKTILITSVMRNQAHLMPRYLQNLENLDYDKKLITLYFYTFNNSDTTFNVINEWVNKNRESYHQIILESHNYPFLPMISSYQPREFDYEEKKVICDFKNSGLQKTKEYGCDYYFFLSPLAFIAPCTLKDLVEKDKPIIAPMLKSMPEPTDHYSNFFYKVDENGYFAGDQEFLRILFRWIKGTYKVPVVYNAYLIKAEFVDKLNYYEDSYDYDFITFSKRAREKGIDQFICNEKEYGVQVHFTNPLSFDDEKQKLKNILLLP